MQAKELIRATDNTKIYLDMDGVLADFFAEYAKMAGVNDYRSIPPASADPTLDKMVGTDFFHRLPKFPTTDALVKLAAVVQRLISAGNKSDDSSEFGLSDDERERLLREAEKEIQSLQRNQEK